MGAVFVFLSGPYSDDPERRVAESKGWAKELIRLGFVPYHAHLSHYQHVSHPEPYENWMQIDLAWIERCDALLRFSRDYSGGADREEARAREVGIEVFYDLPSLVAAFPGVVAGRLI